MNPNSRKSGIMARARIMSFIRLYSDKSGYSPTVREIGDNVGLAPSNVKHHLDYLRARGFIDFVENRARTIRITATYTEE